MCPGQIKRKTGKQWICDMCGMLIYNAHSCFLGVLMCLIAAM